VWLVNQLRLVWGYFSCAVIESAVCIANSGTASCVYRHSVKMSGIAGAACNSSRCQFVYFNVINDAYKADTCTDWFSQSVSQWPNVRFTPKVNKLQRVSLLSGLTKFRIFLALNFLCGFSVDLPLLHKYAIRECIHLLILLYVAGNWALKKGG